MRGIEWRLILRYEQIACHETGEHGQQHFLFGFDDVVRQGVDTGADFSGHGDRVERVVHLRLRDNTQ